MKKCIYTTLVICVLLIGGIKYHAVGEDYGASNFSAEGRKLQPVPTGHVPGKDNGTGSGMHNSGEDCGICHRPNGKAANYIFSISGTLYEDRAARKILKGGEVILQDIDGKVISMTSNNAGNFWTYESIGSNPRSVANHGGGTIILYNGTAPADPTDSRTWQYKAWVTSGDRVLRMVTIAPVGGASDSTSRMSCNMHHAGLGSRGGLWGSQKSTLPSYPAAGLGFKKYILPIFKNKCVPCHIPGSTITRPTTESDISNTPTTVDYSKGIDLTSYSGHAAGGITKMGISNLASAYQSNPDSSPILSTPAGITNHPGGNIWTNSDLDYKAIKQWINEGAQNN